MRDERILARSAMSLPRSGSHAGAMDSEFEWDPRKERLNRLTHGISFQEAATVFEDHLAVTRYDDAHSQEEERYIVLGRSSTGRLLVVVHAERRGRIRIISARRATPRERRDHETRR